MSGAFGTVLLVLALGFAYLRVGRSIAAKSWILPAATAALAALCALMLARSSGGSLSGYAVGVPLGMSAGLLLYHFFDYCRRCGAARPLSLSHARLRCNHCEDAAER